MNEQETLDYVRIAQAIGYIMENFKRQPGSRYSFSMRICSRNVQVPGLTP